MDRTDPGRTRRRRREEPIDQVMQVGRQLVDGVSGARPGRGRGRGEGLSRVGRWMEERLDWFLEDEDDWQEPWQRARPDVPAAPTAPTGPAAPAAPAAPRARESQAPAPPGRRPLEAISRRSLPPAGPGEDAARQQDWPDDSAFRVNRWQRPAASGASRPAGRRPAPAEAARPMPRSSRRRGGA